MESITLYSYEAASASARFAVALDRYFYFGGEQTQVIASDNHSYIICRKVRGTNVSTLEKIIKILSYLLIPILILALALRALLHMAYRATFIYLDSATPETYYRVLAESSPEDVHGCLKNVEGIFLRLPRRYLMALPQAENGVLKRVLLGVNWESLQVDLSLHLEKVESSCCGLRRLFPCLFGKVVEEKLSKEEKIRLVKEFIYFLQNRYTNIKPGEGSPKSLFFPFGGEDSEVNKYMALFQEGDPNLGSEALKFLVSLDMISDYKIGSSGVNIFFE